MHQFFRISGAIFFMAVVLRAPSLLGAERSPVKPDEIKISKPSGNLNLKIGHPSAIGFYDVPTEMTHERLNKQGWKVESVTFSQTALNIQALSQGTVHMSVALSIDPLRAIEKGGKIKWMMENTPGEFVMIAKKEIAKCENLSGRTFAIHGETSGTSVAAKRWILDVCKASPTVMVLPGGENRIIALRNGQIDATLVQLSDWLNLDAQAPGRFHVIVAARTFQHQRVGILDQQRLVGKEPGSGGSLSGRDAKDVSHDQCESEAPREGHTYLCSGHEAGGIARYVENLRPNRRVAAERRGCFNARGCDSILYRTG